MGKFKFVGCLRRCHLLRHFSLLGFLRNAPFPILCIVEKVLRNIFSDNIKFDVYKIPNLDFAKVGMVPSVGDNRN
jgi:hypothetical protein